MTNPHDARREDPPDENEHRKGTLFCPDCGHRSPLGGDWETSADADTYEYHCPDCGASVLSQPVFGSETEPRPATA